MSSLINALKAEARELGKALAEGAIEALEHERQRLLVAARDPETIRNFARGVVDGLKDSSKKKKRRHGENR